MDASEIDHQPGSDEVEPVNVVVVTETPLAYTLGCNITTEENSEISDLDRSENSNSNGQPQSSLVVVVEEDEEDEIDPKIKLGIEKFNKKYQHGIDHLIKEGYLHFNLIVFCRRNLSWQLHQRRKRQRQHQLRHRSYQQKKLRLQRLRQ